MLGQDGGCSYALQLLTIPLLSVLHLAASSSQILSLMNGQLTSPRINLPLRQPKKRPLLLLLTGEGARIVELPIRDRVARYHLDQLGRRDGLLTRSLLDDDGLDVGRKVLLGQNALDRLPVKKHLPPDYFYTGLINHEEWPLVVDAIGEGEEVTVYWLFMGVSGFWTCFMGAYYCVLSIGCS